MLHVHRAERADRLLDAVADLLATPLADPFTTEVIAVPSRGIERWIAQELSRRLGTGSNRSDGVCANVAFPFPGRLIRDAVSAGSGVSPQADPWLPERLTWPLLSVIEENPRAPILGPLRTHLGTEAPGGAGDGLARRLGAVRHVADLFDRYGVHRPEMVRRWRDGDDVGPDLRPLPPRHAWQPGLWRAVRERLDLPSFAERRATALAALREDPQLLDLPARVTIFGLTALPATYLEAITSLAAHRDLHLLLLHPSGELWGRVAAATAAQRASGSGQVLPLRRADPTAELPRNPLLDAWGRDVRELQLVVPVPGDAVVVHHELELWAPCARQTLLRRLQADVRDDRHPGPADGEERPLLDPLDRSVQLHDCHGRLRQVEVLHDAVLHLLEEIDELEPRDVIVMCPEIEAFAPLITAVFGSDQPAPSAPSETGRGSQDGPPPLRVRLADRSLRRTNPVLEVLSQLLELVEQRVTASDVLDLASRAPVRRRFGFGEEDVDTLESWVSELRIRWGFDADHRRRQGLPPLEDHSWHDGLRRLLLGAAMADEDLRLVRGVAPYDGLEGQITDLAGRFVELVARLERALELLRAPRAVDAWRDAIGLVADLLTEVSAEEAWQRRQLHTVLDDLVDEATWHGEVNPVELTLPELRATLSERLSGRPSTTSHRTGDLTFSTLVPMRSVPHRVVCLLGLDDGVYPRQGAADSDDLLGRAPRVGDRDPRSEDRQLLLDALMAATEALVVTFAGRDVRTNERRPPAVPVDELRDVIDRTVRTGDGRRARDHVTVRHPLAQHDPRNFTPGALRADGVPWGFDLPTLVAARSRDAPCAPPAPFLAGALPPPAGDVIALDDLVEFLQHPAKAFVKQRLELTLPSEDEDPIADAIPANLQGLDAWRVGEALVQHWLEGSRREDVLEVLRGRGLVPPGDLATTDLARILETVERLVELCRHLGVVPGPRRGVDVEVALPDGRQLVGTVPRVTGWSLNTVGYGKVGPKHRLAAWTRWLALAALNPARPWEAVTVGRHPWKKGAVQAVRLRSSGESPEGSGALTNLQRLVDLYDRGMRSPIPLYCAASATAAEQRHRDRPVTAFVDKAWETRPHDGYRREDLDPYHVLVLGGQTPTEDLFAEPCRDEEEVSWADDARRFVAYAWRLWEPILQTERSSTR